MSQHRVTDYFTRRKKSITGQVKPAAHFSRLKNSSSAVSAPPAVSENKDLRSSPVREEFVRVIEDAVGLNDGTFINSKNCPRTPKRTSDVIPATTDASPAKKRQVEASRDFKDKVPEKVTKKKFRKKLSDSAPFVQGSCDVTRPLAASAVRRGDVEPSGSFPGEETVGRRPGRPTKALSKEDVANLRSCLQKVKKHQEETTGVASLISTSTSTDSSRVKANLAQARELAAKVQRQKEGREEHSQQHDAETQGSETPAFQRYHGLAQGPSPSLSLPYQYKVLAEMFRSMESVVAMLYNRCETATFAKIKQGVQDMMRKRFEESHVAQIKTVFPEAYTFRQEKNIPLFNSSFKKGSFQLTVEPSFTSDQKESRPHFSASRLLERRQTFSLNLVSIVKHHHAAFLSSLVPPMSVPEDRLTRWHPRFNVDTVPAVEPSPLPQPPQTERASTAQEVLDKARGLITPKMEKALVSLTLAVDGATEVRETAALQTSADRVPDGLRGVSQSLLDRVRAKEAQKMKAAMTRRPGQAERLVMMSRLPELARILRNVFVEEKKPALIMEVACNRMVTSYRSALSPGDMEKHIRLLAEVAADWLAIQPIRKDFYLKLNRKLELSSVVNTLSCRLEEEEKS